MTRASLSSAQKASLARDFQREALASVQAAIDALNDGVEAFVAAAPAMRARMAHALTSYQTFKHASIFDPAIACSEVGHAASARTMKIACISAGELYRLHMRSWDMARIAREWPTYKAALRLIAGQLQRHLVAEADGVLLLLNETPDPRSMYPAHRATA